MVFDLTCAQMRQAKRSACHSSAVGWRAGHHLEVAARPRPAPPRRPGRGSARARRPGSSAARGPESAASLAKSAVTTRMFALAARIGARLVVHRRRDHRFDERRDDRPAAAASIGRLTRDDAAERGERDRRRARARRRRRRRTPVAAPHGLVCLITAAAGSLNSRTMRAAASRSSRLVYESSLPCSTVGGAEARAASRRTSAAG